MSVQVVESAAKDTPGVQDNANTLMCARRTIPLDLKASVAQGGLNGGTGLGPKSDAGDVSPVAYDCCTNIISRLCAA